MMRITETAAQGERARGRPRTVLVGIVGPLLALWGVMVATLPRKAATGWTRGTRWAALLGLPLASLLVAPGTMHASTSSPWAWGYNVLGQLGNGSTTNSSTPVQVSTPSGGHV